MKYELKIIEETGKQHNVHNKSFVKENQVLTCMPGHGQPYIKKRRVNKKIKN